MFARFAFAVIAAVTVSASSHAALLGLTLQPSPDIFSSFISVNYNAGTDVFTASGFALTIDEDNVPPDTAIAGGTFSLVASIDSTGDLISGTLQIGGSFGSFGSPLLTGSLTDFGWNNFGLFEFLFEVTGGSLAIPSYYGNPGAIGGIILDAGANSFVGWQENFGNTGNGVADTAPIPAPGALTMLLAGICLARRRRIS